MRKTNLTQDELKMMLNYDPLTGMFTRKIATNGRRRVGEVVGSSHPKGYIYTKINGFTYPMHRLAWLFIFGFIPDDEIGHIDGNKSNNKISNLRIGTRTTHLQNSTIAYKNSKSGLRGVHRHGKKWESYIKVDGKAIYLGSFDDKNEAHDAYLKAKKTHHIGWV